MYPTIGTVLEQTAERHPEREAILDLRQNRRVTYEQWNRHVNRLARALADAGVKKGDRVSTVLYNTLELGSLFFACAKLGAVFNPVNYRLSTEEISFILRDAEPKVVVFESMVEAQIRPIAERKDDLVFWCIDQGTSQTYAQDYWEMVGQAPDLSMDIDVDEQDTFSIMYTSGTTGKPKGLMHRHRDLIEQSQILIAMTQLTPRDRGLAVAPMFHAAELHCCFSRGCTSAPVTSCCINSMPAPCWRPSSGSK
jgi:fatty-acyl-CoA synthase